jgi:hypothetical protein
VEDAATGRVIARRRLRFWHSGFDDVPPGRPTTDDLTLHWRPDGTCVVSRGWSNWALPSGEDLDYTRQPTWPAAARNRPPATDGVFSPAEGVL